MPNKISITILGDFGAWWGTNRRSIYNAISDNSVEEIDVFMSSYGGEAAEAFVIYDMLRSHKAKVNIFLSGWSLLLPLSLPALAIPSRLRLPIST